MSENLRDEIADVLLREGVHVAPRNISAQTTMMFDQARVRVADAVLAVVGPELDRLRAEAERLRDDNEQHQEQIATYYRASQEWLQVEAERDVLRARLAKVAGLLGEVWDDGNATGLDGWVGPGRGTDPVDDEAVRARERSIERALASVPEPSDSEPAPCGHVERVTGCGGCDPGAVEWVRDDGATHWRRPTADETTLPVEPAPDADHEAGER